MLLLGGLSPKSPGLRGFPFGSLRNPMGKFGGGNVYDSSKYPST